MALFTTAHVDLMKSDGVAGDTVASLAVVVAVVIGVDLSLFGVLSC